MKSSKLLALTLFALTTPNLEAGSLKSDVESLFKDLPTVKVQEVGKSLLVTGEVATLKDLATIENAINALSPKEPLTHSVSLSSQGKADLATQIQKEIDNPNLRVKAVNSTFYLEGIAENDFEADRAIEITKTFLKMSSVREPSSSTLYFSIADLVRIAPKSKLDKPKKKPNSP